MTKTSEIAFSVPDLGAEEEAAVLRVLRSGWITSGEEVVAFENELATYLGVPYVAAVSSCTVALEASLAYLGLEPGSLVAVPDWTFVATGLVCARLNLRPALVDVDPATLNMSVDSLAQLIASPDRPGAVVPVHFGGVPVDERIYGLCRRNGIPVVNDAAHAIGAEDSRGPISGRDVLAECFSFYATKNLTCGEGGAVATYNREVHDFVVAYRLHGLDRDAWKRHRRDSTTAYRLEQPGTKGNLSDVLAALGRVQLAKFPAMQARRSAIVAGYLDALDELPLARPLPSMGALGNAHHLFVVLLDDVLDRDRIRRHLAGNGVATSVHFTPLHEHDWFARHSAVSPSGLDVATRLSKSALSLPLHSRMTPADANDVCAALRLAVEAES